MGNGESSTANFGANVRLSYDEHMLVDRTVAANVREHRHLHAALAVAFRREPAAAPPRALAAAPAGASIARLAARTAASNRSVSQPAPSSGSTTCLAGDSAASMLREVRRRCTLRVVPRLNIPVASIIPPGLGISLDDRLAAANAAIMDAIAASVERAVLAIVVELHDCPNERSSASPPRSPPSPAGPAARVLQQRSAPPLTPLDRSGRSSADVVLLSSMDLDSPGSPPALHTVDTAPQFELPPPPSRVVMHDRGTPPGRGTETMISGAVSEATGEVLLHDTETATMSPGAPSPAGIMMTDGDDDDDEDSLGRQSTGLPVEEVELPPGEWEDCGEAAPGLHWSHAEQLYYSPAEARYYDGGSQMWYDPPSDLWMSHEEHRATSRCRRDEGENGGTAAWSS